jgi:hypothetical protein
MATQARIAPSLACAAAVISGIPVQAQQEQAPLMLPEHVHKTLDCMDALMKQPAIADLLLTLGVGQFTPNGKMAMPTPVHLFSNNYATPRDSGAAIAFVNGAAACAGSGAQEDVQITKIWRAFAAGIFTYGETSMLLYKAMQQPVPRTSLT